MAALSLLVAIAVHRRTCCVPCVCVCVCVCEYVCVCACVFDTDRPALASRASLPPVLDTTVGRAAWPSGSSVGLLAREVRRGASFAVACSSHPRSAPPFLVPCRACLGPPLDPHAGCRSRGHQSMRSQGAPPLPSPPPRSSCWVLVGWA